MTKQSKRNHPTMDKLHRHLQFPDKKTDRHIEKCEECRTSVRLIRAARVSNSPYQYSESLIQKLISVPALAVKDSRRYIVAHTVADSWSMDSAGSVRHEGYGVERRLRFEAEGLIIDLIVDKLGDKSECSLRISRRGRPVPDFVITVGGKSLLPCDKGFFSWITTRPPRELVMKSPLLSITTAEVRW